MADVAVARRDVTDDDEDADDADGDDDHDGAEKEAVHVTDAAEVVQKQILTPMGGSDDDETDDVDVADVHQPLLS